MSDAGRILPPRLAQWWPHFKSVGEQRKCDPLLLAAICDRESNGGEALTPKGPWGTGDHGYGLGLMQIDRRAWPDFASKVDPTGRPLWTLPDWNIDHGAFVLVLGLAAFDGDEAAAVAAYNAGRGRVRRELDELTNPHSEAQRIAALDRLTTGANYVSDVLRRRNSFTPPKESP